MSFPIDYLNRLEDELRTTEVALPARRRFTGALAPRVLLAAALVVLMGGSLALAVGGRVVTAISGSPAPDKVKSELRQMVRPPYPLDGAPPLPKGFLPGRIVRGSERRVLTIRTSRGKIAALYVARTTHGETCMMAVGGPFGSAGCSNSAGEHGPFSDMTTGIRRSDPRDKLHIGRGLTLVGRAAKSGASIVRVVYGDGSHQDIQLVSGWFMFEVPQAHTAVSTAPVRLDVLAADGTVLGSLRHPFPLHPPVLSRPEPRVTDVRLLDSQELPNNGGTVAIWSARDAKGDSCFRHLRNGRSQQSPAWDCSARVGRYGYGPPSASSTRIRNVPVSWAMGLANLPDRPVGYGYAYAFGWVAPQIARLELRFQDGSSTDITLHDRYYLYVVPPANWPAGHRPSILEARDAQGALVYRQFLYPRQHCIYPGRDPACRNFGMGTG